ncbi:MAG: hypothetical protein M1826_006839 [Phylliscum demangeonii]|nr:MAG: hypothetical protein M1826_006839 [Phylliscum demangeonii]
MTSLQPVQDLSFYCIPAAFLLSVSPVLYVSATMMRASNGQWSNALPRQNFERLKGKVPDEVWKRSFRAYSASQNGLEVFPLFAAGVIGAKMAGLPAGEVNTLSLAFLALRALYNVLYTTTSSEATSFLRTATYFIGISVPTWLLVRGGMALNDPASLVR